MTSPEEAAKTAFLKAFDNSIETVYQDLAKTGLSAEAIWSACQQAASSIVDLSREIDQTPSACAPPASPREQSRTRSWSNPRPSIPGPRRAARNNNAIPKPPPNRRRRDQF
jgi:hypothetical protein